MGWGRRGGGSSSSSRRLLLVAGETQRRMRLPLRWLRQWQRCLAFRARGQGGASHHLPTKAQVTQPAPHHHPNITQHLPQFPSIPPPAHLTPGPAEKTESFSPSPPSLLLLLHLPVGAPFNHSASTIQYHSRRIGASRSVPSPSYRIFSLFCSSPLYISENRTSP